ncbi:MULTISPECIES: hypothetical protein [Mycetohabitans]|nr:MULTISPECIES: hypothetical protein [Mycetohabitans]MCF7695544.1 hypothetical protein [Mycetohabitans sp. B2]MCG1046818.1 hypothetical protein [Mycetohabitans sp. B6]
MKRKRTYSESEPIHALPNKRARHWTERSRQRKLSEPTLASDALQDAQQREFHLRTIELIHKSLAGFAQPPQRRLPELEEKNFYYDDQHDANRPDIIYQVKYGPAADISDADKQWLKQYYGEDVTKRYTQYNSKRPFYAEAAQQTGRPLTYQEAAVNEGRDPGSASINHLIASATGQHLINQMTLLHRAGAQQFEEAKKAQSQQGDNIGEEEAESLWKQKRTGLAKQAAAMGRLRGFGRAILADEYARHGYGTELRDVWVATDYNANTLKRNRMAADIQRALEGKTKADRLQAYKNFMANTFDSTGNLRLGHGKGNGRVSTGFDMPITEKATPTPRGRRLFEANYNYGLPEMQVSGRMDNFKPGMFTTVQKTGEPEQNLTSSRWAPRPSNVFQQIAQHVAASGTRLPQPSTARADLSNAQTANRFWFATLRQRMQPQKLHELIAWTRFHSSSSDF